MMISGALLLLLLISTITTHNTDNNEIRLVNGGSQCSGRVEIYHSGEWGTVCDDIWDMNDAEVVCRQLGCGGALSAIHNDQFGESSGPIWLEDVGCLGSESSLSQYTHPGFESHNSGHDEDAGVIFSDSEQIRLVNGSSQCSGRVEIYHGGQWGTVCGDIWDMNS
ncbi:hypothetical protein AAFF_G00198870 [Aldrovandia affinis]|uniref:SRCR domain-containing protein n=1 Tax=Aldrovandia affinis TaxID=143900 RepID=A0AAD7R051_9TELE|nr:hypothetical protein AAFF_G00198870 [Aldrovandia affinis]